ncbi:hypothetical protein T265_00381 [Opisthorchis viverrini]|uniref:Uncharacterized protein n=1 Tax=Opisthorchis viverrini TaxID=6198 RepID=A0A075A6F6_OPIVI|nr:hypothetical protein T265_00381 [Opisthorchis viverrini]KER33947.1 hypothetical protein T265_00381 [Opisthorchis viverrini]
MTHDYYDYSSDDEVIEFRRRNDEARRVRQKARQQIFDEPQEVDTKQVRQLARDVRARVYDDYSEAAHKSRQQDRKTLEYIDAVLNQTNPSYGAYRKSTTPLPVRTKHRKNRRGSQSDYYIVAETNSSGNEDEYHVHMEPRQPVIQPSETARQRVRRIEARLDGILDYELPSADNFRSMRHSLREINDKMATHKLLLDRRTNYELPSAAERSRNRLHGTGFDPALIPGYVTGLSVTNSEQTAELRGRIRTLLCRTRRTAGSEDKHTSLARRRREITVK